MAKFKAILFDYDDTIADTYPPRVEAAKRAAKGYLDPNLDMDRIMKEWAGRPQMEIFSELAGDRQQAQEMLGIFTKWYWKMSPEQVVLFSGIRDMLDELKSDGFTLALVTSKVRLLTNENGPYGAEVEMDRLGLNDIFDVVVGWEDIENPKPAPDPILRALEKLDMEKQDVVMVGDSHIDIKTAKAANVASVGATWGTLAKELLLEEGPDYLVDSPSQLRSILMS